MISIDAARAFAHDYESADQEMESFILAAEMLILDGVGKVDEADARVKLLCKLMVCEMTDFRYLSAAQANSARLLVESLKLQLKTRYGKVSKLDTDKEVMA